MPRNPRTGESGSPLLAARGASVRYEATLALDGVDLELWPGEVHAVVGENGAGKSTLLRSIAGAVPLSAGTLQQRQGTRLAWVPQETELPADLRAADWLFLGAELRSPFRFLRVREMQDAAAAALVAIGCTAPAHVRIRSLPITQRKQVQLARALRVAPDVLLLDEPTAVLGHAETASLFGVIRNLKQRGAGILYVSHRLEEVLAIADRVTVLRDGHRISTEPVDAVDPGRLVQRMVGRAVPARLRTPAARATPAPGAIALEAVRVTVAQVRDFTLTLRRGEVVGLAGLVGAGRSEVLEAIAGLRPLRAGRIACVDAPVLVPEDRSSKGLVRSLSVRENLLLPARRCLLSHRDERAAARQWIQRLRIRAHDCDAAIDSLSGGNQQKLLLARALHHQPKLLLLDEPTAGVDVGAKAEIHDLIGQLASAGAAILIASSDLPELLALCDRVVALHDGEIVGMLAGHEATEARLAALITGAEVRAADSRQPGVESR